jgi:hypothetical protein
MQRIRKKIGAVLLTLVFAGIFVFLLRDFRRLPLSAGYGVVPLCAFILLVVLVIPIGWVRPQWLTSPVNVVFTLSCWVLFEINSWQSHGYKMNSYIFIFLWVAIISTYILVLREWKRSKKAEISICRVEEQE